MRTFNLVSIACLVGQFVAYGKSSLKQGNPVHCIGIPFGECETIVANGWAVVMQGYGREYNLEAAVTVFVGLSMWLSLVIGVHNPKFTMRRGGKSKISPGGYIYTLLFLVVVGLAAMTIMKK